MDPSLSARIHELRRRLGLGRKGMSGMAWLSSGGGEPARQVELAPPGLTFSEDVSHGRWVEESLSGWATVGSMLPEGFEAYARVFHPAYIGDSRERPVRWSEVASWSGKVAHPLMQFPRIAGLGRGLQDAHRNPPWGRRPRCGSLPADECAALANLLHRFTSTAEDCFFCLWEGYGNIDTRLYKAGSRVRAPGRDYLLFRGPLDAVMSFLDRRQAPFWGDSPNIWWLRTGPGAWQRTSTYSTPTWQATSSASRPSWASQTWRLCQPASMLAWTWPGTR